MPSKKALTPPLPDKWSSLFSGGETIIIVGTKYKLLGETERNKVYIEIFLNASPVIPIIPIGITLEPPYKYLCVSQDDTLPTNTVFLLQPSLEYPGQNKLIDTGMLLANFRHVIEKSKNQT